MAFAQKADSSIKNTRRQKPVSPQDQTRNTQTVYPEQATTEQSALTTDEQFSAAYATAGVRSPRLKDKGAGQPPNSAARRAQVEYTTQPHQKKAAKQLRKIRRFVGKKKRGAEASPAAQLRAIRVNLRIFAWGIPGWLFFQLPLAIFSTVAFGFAYAVAEVQDFISKYSVSSLAKPEADDGWLVSNIKSAVNNTVDFVSGAITTADQLINDATGISVSGFLSGAADALNPANPFVITWVILMMYGFFMLFVMYMNYMLARLEPIGGQKSGMKQGVLLLSAIGYSLPILNIFPWFIAWGIIVSRYPK